MAIPKYGKSVRLPTQDLPTFQQWRSPILSGGKPPPLLQDPTDDFQDRPARTSERSQAVGQGLRCELRAFCLQALKRSTGTDLTGRV